ncbi:uncharacterized protein LOC144560268 [Carex rostrata]
MLEPSDMSMLGIDLGSWSCHVICGLGDWNDCSFSRTNVCGFKTQISQIKSLLGRKFSDPELQLELDYVPFRVIEGPDGYPVVHSRCKGEDRAFTPVEILAMLISSPQFQACKEYSDASPCIGIPIYFTNQQKKEVLQAAKIVGLPSSFCLLDETTAMVLALESNRLLEPQGIVAFVDIGHASMQVCFAEFIGKHDDMVRYTNILYKGYARSLGGREFDKVLFKHFASKIRKEYNIDVSEYSSACVKLSEACEILKYDLSTKNEASFCIENFYGSITVKGSMKRKDFKRLTISILKKIEVALKKALMESRLNVEKIELIEVVGKGCSIPAIIDIVTKIFGKKLSKTTHFEHVARGCAMHARQQNVMGTDQMINGLTTGLETSQLVSTELNSQEEKTEDSEKFIWRRAMDEDGHLLTFLNDFLEENMHRIGRSEKTEDESYWLSKPNFPTGSYSELQDATHNIQESSKLGEDGFGIMYKGLQKISTVAIKKLKGISHGTKELNQKISTLRDDRTSSTEEKKNKQNNPDNANEESPAVQIELLKAQKLIEQLMSERDYARKEVEELRQLTEQQVPGSQYVGYFTEYSSSDLRDATNNFDESFKLGEGGFGIVYKGVLHNTNIAIKIMKETSSEGAKEFHQEIEILSKLRHPNLVTLIGACAETRAVIYEYLPNGTLEDRLRCKNNTLPLQWQARIRIAFEICSALSFLHCSKPHGIVHGDLKPDNILLDLNDVSKIGDFGLCRELNWTASASVPYHWTDCPKGTLAYMDPEFLSIGKLTPQYDVYSFGIMLLRLVTCKHPRGIRNLVEEAQRKGTLNALIDASAGPWPFKEAKKMLSLGLRCSDLKRKNRPDLSTKVWKEMKSMSDVASASVSL